MQYRPSYFQIPLEEYDHFIGYLEGQLKRVTIQDAEVGDVTARLGAKVRAKTPLPFEIEKKHKLDSERQRLQTKL